MANVHSHGSAKNSGMTQSGKQSMTISGNSRSQAWHSPKIVELKMQLKISPWLPNLIFLTCYIKLSVISNGLSLLMFVFCFNNLKNDYIKI